MSFDPEQFDLDDQTRLREIPGVTVGDVESVEEALTRQGPVPFVATLYDGAKSDGRLVAGNPGQRLRVRRSVVIVTEGWRSRGQGRAGALAVLRAVKTKLVTRGSARGEWQNPQADGPYVFDEDAFMQRSGQRVAYQAEFHTDVYDDFI